MKLYICLVLFKGACVHQEPVDLGLRATDSQNIFRDSLTHCWFLVFAYSLLTKDNFIFKKYLYCHIDANFIALKNIFKKIIIFVALAIIFLLG